MASFITHAAVAATMVKIGSSGSNKVNSRNYWLCAAILSCSPDLDVITHEVMHIVQSYPPNSGPGWLTEGIADYVRFKYGVDNKGAGWSLPDYKPENSYKNSYRITARFLYWLTKKYDKNIVQKLDKNMRNKTYSEDLWNQYTGKSLDALWAEYSESPQIS